MITRISKFFISLRESIPTLKKSSSSTKDSSSYVFEDLAPKDDLDKNVYMVALGEALENEKIKNIAITGNYGSGKSSIIASFQKQYPKYKYLNVSLASFRITEANKNHVDETNPKQENSDSKKDQIDHDDHINQLIERSILQQIFYSTNPKEIPDSRFKRIYAINPTKPFFNAIAILIWVSAAFKLAKPEVFKPFTIGTIKSDSQIFKEFQKLYTDYFSHWPSIIFTVGVIWIVYIILKNLSRLRFSKLNLAKGEIELAKKDDSSILNRHLDEIVYFFQMKKHHVVVFEDLDRFNNREIFTKLRELNILLNKPRKPKNRIRFIYALKDDLFNDSTRAKFFDFIIPIIPIIDSSNSGEILLKKLEKRDSQDGLSKEFLLDIAFYVQDMRLLTNICNEYEIYRRNLESLKINLNKLFAIIIYKNLMPEDFGKLQLNSGKIYDAFENKDSLIQHRKEEIQNEIRQIKKEIRHIEQEHLNSTEELQTLYTSAVLRKIPFRSGFNKTLWIEDAEVSFESFLTERGFRAIENEEDITYNSGYGKSSIKYSLKDIQEFLEDPQTYHERADIIRYGANKSMQLAKQEMARVQKRLEALESQSLTILLNEGDSKSYIAREIRENELLLFLLRNGYIDETYSDYISYFYEGSLTIDDKRFVRSVKNRIPLPYDFELKNFEGVLRLLHKGEFYQEEVFNFYLLNYFLKDQIRFKQELDIIIRHNTEGRNRNFFEFLDQCVDREEIDSYSLINYTCKRWIDIWSYIPSNQSFLDADKYLNLLLLFADTGDLLSAEEESSGALRRAASDIDLIVEKYEKEQQVWDKLRALGVKVKKASKSIATSKLVAFLYEHELYELNIDMLKVILTDHLTENKISEDGFIKANYSLIQESDLDHLIQYVDRNIIKYVDEVLLRNQTIEDSLPYVLELLNNSQIPLDKRVQLIEIQHEKIEILSSVEDKELWSSLLQNQKLVPSWENVSLYFEYVEAINDVLLSYLCLEYSLSKFSDQKLDYDKHKKLVIAILSKDEFSDNCYKILVHQAAVFYENFTLDHLSYEKVAFLINDQKIILTKENYVFLKENYDLHIELIEKDKNNFLESIRDYPLETYDFQRVLASSILDDLEKQEVVLSYKPDEFKLNGTISNDIILLFLEGSEIKIPGDWLLFLLKKARQTDIKLKLFTKRIYRFSTKEITDLLESFGDPYPLVTKKGLRPKLSNSKLNLDLVSSLKAKEYISSYKIEKDGRIRINTKRQ